MQLITTTGSEHTANAVIRLNPLDDVLIARQALPEGLLLDEGITVCQAIPAGHKVAARD
ncbi:altronate dehydratase, partial [Pseudomonas sp. SIMBA_059]